MRSSLNFSEKQDLVQLLLHKRTIRARSSLAAWCELALEPLGQKPARHHRLLISALEDVASGKTERLMVMMPPGSAKSTFGSVLFPAWFLARGQQSLITASSTASLAETFSRRVMGLVREHSDVLGYSLTRESAEQWDTDNGCACFAAGVGGTVTGRRADLAIIDDPVRGREDADSKTIREKTWAWYWSDLRSRLKPGGRVVLISTRWHEDDLAGRLLATEKDRWRVISFPAIATSDDQLGRKPGEPLWSDDGYGYGAELLTRRDEANRKGGMRDWHALYQQTPRPDEGSIIKSDWWQPWTDPAPDRPDFIIVSLDTAYTDKDSNDPTACTIWHVVEDRKTYRSVTLLRYAWAKHLTFPELIDEISETCRHFGKPGVPLRVLIEAKASGLSVIQEMRRRSPHLHITPVQPRGDKVARAHAVTSLLEAGMVFAMAKDDGDGPVFRPYVQDVIDECAAFPVAAHDDRVDSTTQALRFVRDSGVDLFEADEPPLTYDGSEPVALY